VRDTTGDDSYIALPYLGEDAFDRMLIRDSADCAYIKVEHDTIAPPDKYYPDDYPTLTRLSRESGKPAIVVFVSPGEAVWYVSNRMKETLLIHDPAGDLDGTETIPRDSG